MDIFKPVLVLFCLMGTTSVLASNAAPSLNAKCSYSVATPKNGTGVIFDELCTAAYVLPPKSGVAEISSLARTTNLQFCSEVKDVNRVSKTTLNSIAIVAEKIGKMISGFEPLEKEVIDLREGMASGKSRRDVTKIRFEQAEAQLQEMRKEEREARHSYQDCLEDNPNDSSKCVEMKTAWDEVKRELDTFRRGDYRIKREEANIAEEGFDLLLKRTEEMSRRYTEAIAPMFELQKNLVELNSLVKDFYRDYARLEGATGRILWTVQWDKLLEDYRQANSKLPIKWSKILMKEAQLTSSVKMASGSAKVELDGLPAVKAAFIPGAKPTGFSGMGNGEVVTGAQLQPSPPSEASTVFGDGISGQIVLTLVGACPYFEDIDNRSKLDINELVEHMAANLVYTYELSARRGYFATYNLSNLLSKFEEKTKEGGLFTTSAAHSIAETDESRDWFSIDFSGNTADFQYSATEQAQLAITIKKELIDRALKQFSIFNAGEATPGQVPNFLESGASKASGELRKCFHHYCQVASGVLGVADSIWGNSTATASFHRNNSNWTSERINGIQFVNRSGSLTFAPSN